MTAVTTTTENNLPAHLQKGKTASFGNIDQSDLIIPRIKLLQAVSEEVQAFDNADVGQFWHTLLEEPMGDRLRFVPLILKKEMVLWAPRGDDRGILARSSDCINWDEGFANMEFEVTIKNVGKVKYNTRNNVADSGLAEFGSAVPSDPNSRPAASLTYRMMFYFPDFPEASPAIIINTRSSIRAAKGLISKIELRPVDHYDQMFEMYTTEEKGEEGPYKGYGYKAAGYTNAEEHEITKGLYEKFKSLEWGTNDTEIEEALATDKTVVEGSTVDRSAGGKTAKASGNEKF